MKLKAYNVKCIDAKASEYEVGVLASDDSSAKRSAEHSLMEGRHIAADAVSCQEIGTTRQPGF